MDSGKQKKNIIEECYKQAIETIRKCSNKNGLYASGGIRGYNAVWARDSMITLIGASLVNDKRIRETYKKSIILLAKHQSKRGQIPNAVDIFSERKPHVDFASIDSSLLFIIGHHYYMKRYKKNPLPKKYQSSIKKALTWLQYMDTGENGLLVQLPTTDWQDAFPHKYGYTINTHALYYKALQITGNKKEAKIVKYMIDEKKDTKLWTGDYYASYRWKNHNKYKEIGEWFDTLGNLFSIIFDLADKDKAKKILKYIEDKKINKPYPAKAIFPPIKKGSKNWHEYFEDCDARNPNSYLNGGIWPFIGGVYVLSLIKLGRIQQAQKELTNLAESNLKGNFPEWIHPVTKNTYGNLQAWDAGMYILAYNSLKKKKVLL
ncbi:MAG: amylo-alpha-1,6-glucosidase [Candidatus Woesearchaeota archaeon]